MTKVSDAVVSPNRRPLIIAGIVLGLGQSGFFDGIVIHQLLQWHHMFTNVETDQTVAGLALNTLGDGLFHLLDWLLTLAGIGLLWRASKKEDVSKSTPVFLGSLLMGAGLFDFVEGLIDHQLLGIHHVKPGPNEFAWDMGFLALGLGLLGLGWAVTRIKPSDAGTKTAVISSLRQR
ncbi:MAG: DUF2243 domain-containing protein [Phormidesmis sp.]